MRVLLIEDNPGDARLIREYLAEGRAEALLIWVDRLAAGIEQLAAGPVDAVLLDLSLPDSHGLETFTRVRDHAPGAPVVVLSGLSDETMAVRAVQEGAQDYLIKGQVDGQLLVRALRYAIERKRLDEARRDLERQKDRFFANISHDLRTPLAAIKASIGVVLANEPPGTSEPIHRLLVNIDLAADEMAVLVDDLLQLNRLQAGRVRLRPTRLDLRERVLRAAQALEPLAGTRRQRVEVEVPPEPVEIVADADQFDRILRNLLGNAHKHGRDGGLIRLCLYPADAGAVRIAVSDDGPGVPPAEQERIFERYYQIESEARRSPGSGLGLPIARALVELHGGQLTLESLPGAGATFWVRLPDQES